MNIKKIIPLLRQYWQFIPRTFSYIQHRGVHKIYKKRIVRNNNWKIALAQSFRHLKKIFRKHKNRKALLIGSLIIIILAPLVIFLSRKPAVVEAGWFDQRWLYRKTISITNSSTPLTNFQVAFTLDTSTLISSNKLASTCNDIRITSIDNQIQNHWVEDCNTTTTKIWIKIASLPVESQYYYIYYGNSTADNIENPSTVFDFYDGFSGTTIDTSTWTVNATDYAVADGSIRLNVGAIRTTSALPFNLNDGYILEGRMYTHATTNVWGGTLTATDNAAYVQGNNAGSNAMILLMRATNSTNVVRYVANGSAASYNISNNVTTYTANNSTWYTFSEAFHSAGLNLSQNYGTSTNLSFSWSKNPKYITLGQFSGDVNLQDTSYDWVRVRKYATTEPTVSLSSQEVGVKPVAQYHFDEGFDQQDYAPPLTSHESQLVFVDTLSAYSAGWVEVGGTYYSFSPFETITWDSSKYPNSTVYLEANLLPRNDHPWASCTAKLYSTGGVEVSNSVTASSNTPGSWKRVRSGAISLTHGTSYELRLTYNYTASCSVKSARLIVVQNADLLAATSTKVNMDNLGLTNSSSYTALTNTYLYDQSKFSPSPTTYLEANLMAEPPTIEQQVNIINSEYTQTGTTYIPTDNSFGIFHWESDKYSNSTIYFEAVIKGSSNYASPRYYAAIYDTNGNYVSSSEVSGVSITSYTRLRSGPISLNNNTDYTVRIKSNNGSYSTSINSAKLIIIQSDSTKITNTRTQVEVGSVETTTSTSYATLTDKKIYKYDSTKFTPTIESSGDVSFNASLKIADPFDTVWAGLYNLSGNLVAEVSHTGDTNWKLKTIANIDSDSDWNTASDDEYEVRIRCEDHNGGGCSGSIANAKVILDQYDTGGITALELIHQQINKLQTQATTTPTQKNYFSRFNPGLEITQTSFAGGQFAYFFESVLKTDAGTAYSRLYNITTGAAITNSTVSTDSTSYPNYSRVRSVDITSNIPSWPTTRNIQYLDSQIYNSATNTTSVSSSTLIIQVSNLATSAPTAYADLYNLTDQVVVADSEVSNNSTTYINKRSNPITLASNKEYVIRFKTSVVGNPARLLGSSLIHDQSSPTDGLKSIETTQRLVNDTVTQANNTYTSKDSLIYYDGSNFSNSDFGSVFYEADLKTSAGTGFSRLRNTTDSTDITSSEISTTSANYTRVRSTNIISTLVNGKTYDTQIKNLATDTTSLNNSKLVVHNTKSPTTAYGVAHDSSSNGLHAFLVNSPVWNTQSDCYQQNCINFINSSGYGLITDNPEFDFAASDSFTITTWFKHSQASSTHMLLSKFESTGSDGGYQIYLNSAGKIVGGITDINTTFPKDSVTSSTRVDDNKWHHLALVKNSTGALKLYLDGRLSDQDIVISTTNTLVNNDSLHIGIANDKSSNPFNGSIDELKFYLFAMSESELLIDYNSGSAVMDQTQDRTLTNGLVAHLKMDESVSPSQDSSGNGNHATWQDNTASTVGKFGKAIDLDGSGDQATIDAPNAIPGYAAWNRKKPIAITNANGTTLTNYQVKLTIAYDADMQPDFDDLLFSNLDGTSLDYWLESKTDSTTATVWVEVDSIPSTGTTIYMYYGNPIISSSSNSSATFLFGDDFSGPSLASGWTEVTLGGASVGTLSQGKWTKTCDGECDWWNTTDLDAGIYASFPTKAGSDTTWEAIAKIDSVVGTGNRNMGMMLRQGARDGWIWAYNPAVSYFLATVTGGSDACTIASTTFPSWMKIIKTTANGVASNNDFTFWRSIDGATWSRCGTYTATDTMSGLGLMIKDWTTGVTSATYDHFIVKEYATTEPTASFGAEELHDPINVTMSAFAWVNADTLDATNRTIFANGSSGEYTWAIANDSANPGKLTFTSDGITSGTSQTTLTTGTWYHVGLTITNTSTTLYINGQADATITSQPFSPSLANLSVGADTDGTHGFDGKIDEFRIYNRALSAAEVYQLYTWSPSMIAWWKLDENKGASTSDSSGNGNNSSIFTTNTTWTTGKYGSALKFDGVNDVIKITETATTDIGDITDTYTLNAWIKTTANFSANATIAAKDDGSGAFPYSLYLDSSEHACFSISDGTNNPSTCNSVPLNDGNFHYLTGIRNTSTDKIYLYVNGILVSETTDTTTATATNNADVSLGNSGTDYLANDWNGIIDEVKLYDYVRNNWEINADMQSGAAIGGVPHSSALLHLNFDEGYGATAHNGGSAPSANATITNGTWSTAGKMGNAVAFTASTSVTATIPDPGYQNSISLWIKPTTSIINKTLVNSDKLTTNASGQPVYGNCTGTTLNLDQWTHILAVSAASNSCQLYQNGVLTATNVNGVSLGTSINIGGSSFTGLIDDIKIYSFALDSYQAKVETNQGKIAVFGAGANPDTSLATWKFDENTGTTVNDSSSYDYVGSWHGTGTHWSNGKIGPAGFFNGSDDYVSVASTIDNVKTINFWVKPNSTTTNILSLNGSTNITASGGTLSAAGFDSPTIYVNGQTTTSISAGIWQYITVTTDTPISASAISIGKVNTNFFTGLIDQVTLFSGVRTPTQIIYDYNQGKPVVHYKLDECQNTVAHNSTSDANGNAVNLHGTINMGSGGNNTIINSCISQSVNDMWFNGVTGKYNASLQFDGTDDIVTVTDHSSLQFDANTQDFSLFTWINREPTTIADPNSGGTATAANGYYIHTFTTSGTFIVSDTQNVEVLVVAGGGGGGGDVGGGGGGGGIIYNSNFTVEAGEITVTVGDGGSAGGTGGDGANSVFSTLIAYGGGGGGNYSGGAGRSGGSGGGGAGISGIGGSGTSGQGNSGGTAWSGSYAGGSGGGAGTAGLTPTDGNGRAGGDGLEFSISGISTYYGGGGGAGGNAGSGAGGLGGGGIGTIRGGGAGGSGTANTGGGGGGPGGNQGGGAGGSGIVIVRYPIQYGTLTFQEQYLISKEDSDNDGYRLLINEDNTVTCSINDVDITSTKTISDPNWHHLGCVIDRDSNGQVYIDGVPASPLVPVSSPSLATTANLTFGARSYTPTSHFNGKLDDIRLYNYALTPNQIKTIMNNGAISFQ